MTTSLVPSAGVGGTRLLFFGVLLSITACGAPRAAGDVGSSPDVITRQEILSVGDGDAYTIVRQLRPRWLRPRTQATFGSARDAALTGGDPAIYPEVFQDEIPFGPVETLSSFQSANIQRIEWINSLDATTRYGTGYMGGIIRVVIRR